MNTIQDVAGPTLRRARQEDLAAITALLVGSDLPTTGVAEALKGFVVAEDAGEIVGVVGIEACCDRYALLRSTAVAQSWRGRGLGRRLVERAVSEAESQGIEALYLLTTTAETYFPSFGFATVSRDSVPDAVKGTDEFQSACPASATVMALSLAHAG